MENKRNSGKSDKLSWHLAFYQAMQMELFDYFDDIEITFEHQLTSEPLRIDVLVVKKRKDVIIDKSIARIFRGHNIIEYKSPEDSFSARDFLQVCAYMNHYAANTPDVNAVDDADLSLTFVGNRYPRALLRYLTERRKYKAEHSAPGIYLIHGDYFPIQIIETKRLPENESLWLHSLTNKLRINSARAILEASNDEARKMYIDAYLDVLMRSNRRAFMEVSNMRSKYPTLEEVLDDMGVHNWVRQGREEGRAEGETQTKEKIVCNLLSLGMSIEEIARATELPIARVRSLKKNIEQ